MHCVRHYAHRKCATSLNYIKFLYLFSLFSVCNFLYLQNISITRNVTVKGKENITSEVQFTNTFIFDVQVLLKDIQILNIQSSSIVNSTFLVITENSLNTKVTVNNSQFVNSFLEIKNVEQIEILNCLFKSELYNPDPKIFEEYKDPDFTSEDIDRIFSAFGSELASLKDTVDDYLVVASGNVSKTGVTVLGSTFLMIENTTFVNISTPYDEPSGALFLSDVKRGFIKESIFQVNIGRIGAGIVIEDSDINIINSHFRHNKASRQGSTIYVTAHNFSLLLEGNQFEGNFVGYQGTIFINDPMVVISKKNTFIWNRSSGYGGIYLKYSVYFSDVDTVYMGNIARQEGGAIYAQKYSQVRVSNVLFEYNLARYGGGISGKDNSDIFSVGCTFKGNKAGDKGMYYAKHGLRLRNKLYIVSDTSHELGQPKGMTPFVFNAEQCP